MFEVKKVGHSREEKLGGVKTMCSSIFNGLVLGTRSSDSRGASKPSTLGFPWVTGTIGAERTVLDRAGEVLGASWPSTESPS